MTTSKGEEKMGKRMIKVLLGLSGITVLVVALFLSGCSLKSPLMSDVENNDLEAILSVDQAKEAGTDGLAKPDGSVYLIASSSKRHEFDDDDFSLSLILDGQEIVFSFPEDAIDDDDDSEIEIIAEKWNTVNGPVFYYICLPSGLVFEEPITLKQPLRNYDNGVKNLYWKDPVTNKWIVEDFESVVSGVVKFKISHFSKYAISD